MIIGITGFIGVGKTTSAEILAKQGIGIIDADKLGHEVLRDKEIINKIIGLFGEKVADRKMEIDRKVLGKIVFSNPEYIRNLNHIVHSKLKRILHDELKQANLSKKNVIVDVALLAEFGLEEVCDHIILIKADFEKVYLRMAKDYDKKQIVTIMNHQKMPQNPGFIIENNGGLEELNSKIEGVWKEINIVK